MKVKGMNRKSKKKRTWVYLNVQTANRDEVEMSEGFDLPKKSAYLLASRLK